MSTIFADEFSLAGNHLAIFPSVFVAFSLALLIPVIYQPLRRDKKKAAEMGGKEIVRR